jgi:protein TonB
MDFSPVPGPRNNNLTGIAFVLAIHVLLAVLVASGSRLAVLKQKPAEIDLVQTPLAPPPPPPALPDPPPMAAPATPQIYVPVLETPVVATAQPTLTAHPMPDQPPAAASAGPAAGMPAATPGPAKAGPVRVPAVVDASACSKPDYPKNALRNGDTGTVTLQLLVGVDGRVTDSRVEKSSGYRELDRAAQTGLSLCRFKPETLDGVPRESWTRMQYLWSLDD